MHPYRSRKKIYNYTNTMRTVNDTRWIYKFMQLITGMRYFWISLRGTCFNNKKYSVLMKLRLLIGGHIRIGRRLHVNQPLYRRSVLAVAAWINGEPISIYYKAALGSPLLNTTTARPRFSAYIITKLYATHWCIQQWCYRHLWHIL